MFYGREERTDIWGLEKKHERRKISVPLILELRCLQALVLNYIHTKPNYEGANSSDRIT